MIQSKRQTSIIILNKNKLRLNNHITVRLNNRNLYQRILKLLQYQLLHPKKYKQSKTNIKCKQSQMYTILSKDLFNQCLIIQEIIIILKWKYKKLIIKYNHTHKIQQITNQGLHPKKWIWHTYKIVMIETWINQLILMYMIKNKNKKVRNQSFKPQWL